MSSYVSHFGAVLLRLKFHGATFLDKLCAYSAQFSLAKQSFLWLCSCFALGHWLEQRQGQGDPWFGSGLKGTAVNNEDLGLGHGAKKCSEMLRGASWPQASGFRQQSLREAENNPQVALLRIRPVYRRAALGVGMVLSCFPFLFATCLFLHPLGKTGVRGTLTKSLSSWFFWTKLRNWLNLSRTAFM